MSLQCFAAVPCRPRPAWCLAALMLVVVLAASALPAMSAAPVASTAVLRAAPDTKQAQAVFHSFLPMVESAAQPSTSVVQSLFYDRPTDGTTLDTVIKKSRLIVLSRGADSWLNELKQADYPGPVLQYFLGLEVGGPGPYPHYAAGCDTGHTPIRNTIGYNAGDFCRYIHPNEDWFLHNSKGERLYSPSGNGSINYQMNPASANWRAYARQFIASDLLGDATQAKVGFDGIFLDNIPLQLTKLLSSVTNSDGGVQEFADQKVYQAAVVEYLSYLGAVLRQGGPLYANLIDGNVPIDTYLRFTAQLDGYMNESWATGWAESELNPSRWNEQLRIAEATQEQGKGLMATAQGRRYDNARQRFALASYLLIASGNKAFFRYADHWDSYHNWYQYDNYDVQLGAPLGKRYKTGNRWRRDFTCGFVIVDPAAHSGTIQPSSCAG